MLPDMFEHIGSNKYEQGFNLTPPQDGMFGFGGSPPAYTNLRVGSLSIVAGSAPTGLGSAELIGWLPGQARVLIHYNT
jgi:hypothetical protein